MGALSDAAGWFKARKTPIQAWYDDDHGRYAFKVTVDSEPFVVAAKKYLYAGNASFMDKVVLRANDYDAKLLLFVVDRSNPYVFNPQTVIEDGTDADGPRSSNRGEAWTDVDAKAGVPLEDYVDGRDTPKRPESERDPPDGSDTPENLSTWEDYGEDQ